MFKKLNLKTLLVILALVGGVFLISRQWGNDDRSFRDIITDFNPDKVKSITYVKKGGRAVDLSKDKNQWMVSQGGREFISDSSRVRSMLQQISSLKTKQLVARSKKKWEEYQVTDSSGTYVEVRGKDSPLASLYVGKFSYKQPPGQNQQMAGRRPRGEMTTYVRVDGEQEVYAVDGFLSMAFPADINQLRDKTLLSFAKSQARKISVSAVENYSLDKSSGTWLIDGNAADSASVASYLNTISQFNGQKFSDKKLKGSPDKTLGIELENGSLFSLSAYKNQPGGEKEKADYLVNSSLNPEAVFLIKQPKIDGLFKPKSYFEK